MPTLTPRPSRADGAPAHAPPAQAPKAPRGIQSVEVGGALLRALADHGRPMALKDLAQSAGMPAAQAHPYLVSYGKLGLVEQDAASGRYGLGPLALQLGLISLQQHDPVRLATACIEPLAASLRLTMLIAVWGQRGPTIVRVATPPEALYVTVRHGAVMSLRGTASGQLFASHLSADALAQALAQEGGPRRIDPALREGLAQTRAQGYAATHDGVLAGISALAAPVYDASGSLVLALTAVGPTPVLDLRPGSAQVRALCSAAEALSRQLGGGAGTQA